MEILRKIAKAILFPHGALFILLAPISIALLVYSLAFREAQDTISYVSYAVSAYTLTALCCKTPSFIRFFNRVRQENRYVVKYRSDAHLRVNLSLYGSLAYNTAYAIFQLGLGFFHASVWFYSMAVYYILLAVMRFYLLQYTKSHIPGEDRQAELHRYRFCGVILVLMNLALSVIVFYITWQNRTFRHHEITTITMAAYTFTSFTMAVINMVKYRKYHSPVFSAAKAVSFAAAMVSMLTLETAMLTVFGENGQETFRRVMTASTGGAVALAVLVMAVYMIVRSTLELGRLDRENAET